MGNQNGKAVIGFVLVGGIVAFVVSNQRKEPAALTPHPSSSTTQPRKTVVGNNGSVTCDMYCSGSHGGPWNNELPREWGGANCVGSGPNWSLPCGHINGTPIHCLCERAPRKGWRA